MLTGLSPTCSVAETAVRTQFVGLCDVDFTGIVEGQSQSLGEDVGASEVVGGVSACR